MKMEITILCLYLILELMKSNVAHEITFFLYLNKKKLTNTNNSTRTIMKRIERKIQFIS